eukprot:2114520-Pyramimonas_sp.AAC.1
MLTMRFVAPRSRDQAARRQRGRIRSHTISLHPTLYPRDLPGHFRGGIAPLWGTRLGVLAGFAENERNLASTF